jgi:hypothetical protein
MVTKCLLLKAKLTKSVYDDVLDLFNNKCPSFSTVKNCVTRFRKGHLTTEGKERSRRPTLETISENVEAIHSTIIKD